MSQSQGTVLLVDKKNVSNTAAEVTQLSQMPKIYFKTDQLKHLKHCELKQHSGYSWSLEVKRD